MYHFSKNKFYLVSNYALLDFNLFDETNVVVIDGKIRRYYFKVSFEAKLSLQVIHKFIIYFFSQARNSVYRIIYLYNFPNTNSLDSTACNK